MYTFEPPPPKKKKDMEKSSIKDCRALHAGQILFGSRIMSVEVNIFCPVCLDAFSPIIIPKFLHCGHRLCLLCATVSIFFFLYLFVLFVTAFLFVRKKILFRTSIVRRLVGSHVRYAER